ncbi:MAG: proton-translocating transhydrogenase family protein [Janthinobacterium lividum]
MDPLVFAITVFVLASFVGYYVVWKVTPALHTPLMSITNAISGIIVLSSMIAASSSAFGFSGLLGIFATLLASINIFGGFIVTKRMLEMFKKKS